MFVTFKLFSSPTTAVKKFLLLRKIWPKSFVTFVRGCNRRLAFVIFNLFCLRRSYDGRHDTQHNDTQHNNIQYTNKQNATLSIMTLSIMTLSIMTFSIITFSIMTFSIMTFSIKTFSIIINKTRHSA